MAAYLMTGFDLDRVGALAASLNDGTDSGTAELTTGRFCHRDLSSVMGSGVYADFASAWDIEANTVLTTNGCAVTFSTSTLRYTWGSFIGATTIDFTSATLGDERGTRLAAALGFDYQHANASGGSASDPFDISLSGASSYVGNVAPYYLLDLARDGVSEYSRPFETQGQTERSVSTLGNAYSIGPTNREQQVTWNARFQALESVFAAEATALAWTYEDLIKHARCWEPILLHTSSVDDVVLNIEGDFHEGARTPVWNSYHGKWDLPFRGQYLGGI